MPIQLAKFLAAAVLAAALPALVHAAAPSFAVKCMRSAGTADGEKYGTYYFFLKDGIVKGFACSQPGRPCQIVSQDAQKIVFQTPGELPDTLVIDLRTGAIERTSEDGLQWQYACKQVPYRT